MLRAGEGWEEVVAFIIGILLAFADKKAAATWQRGAKIIGLKCPVNRN